MCSPGWDTETFVVRRDRRGAEPEDGADAGAGDEGSGPATHRGRRLVGVVLLVATAAGASYLWWRRPGPDTDEFCARLGPVAAIDDRLATDPAGIDDDLDALRAAAARAPEAIRPDLDTVIAALDRLAAAAESRPDDPNGALTDELLAMSDQVESIERSSQRLGSWTRATCGLELTGTRDTRRGPATSAGGAPTTAEDR